MTQAGLSVRRGDGGKAALFLAPVLLGGLVFYAAPIAASLALSLTNWNPLARTRWVGLDNYVYLLTRDPLLARSLVNTFVFAFGGVAVGVPLALLIAHAISLSRGTAVWRSIFWLPMVTNVVAVAFVWQILLHPAYGLVNRGLGLLGLPGPGWLTDPATAMLSVVAVSTWLNVGHNVLLLSAGMQGIDASCYEAARLDGARDRDLFWSITLPLLRPTLYFVTVTNLIAGFGAFALVLVLTDGGPQRSTEVTALYLYQMAFADLRMGRACAVAYILMGLVLAATWLLSRAFRRGGVEAH